MQMKPVSPVFKDEPLLSQVVWAENQPEYNPLPAVEIVEYEQTVTYSRWQLTWKERVKILFTGSLYHGALRFGNPLQPIILTVDEPEVDSGT